MAGVTQSTLTALYEKLLCVEKATQILADTRNVHTEYILLPNGPDGFELSHAKQTGSCCRLFLRQYSLLTTAMCTWVTTVRGDSQYPP